MHEAKARCEHRLEPDRARSRLGEGQALHLDILRIVIRHDHVEQPFGERLDQRGPVRLGAQRRGDLEEGAVGADVDFVEREVIDRSRGRDAEPGLLGAAEHRKRVGAGDRSGMIARLREGHEPQVAFEHDRLGRLRNAEQAKACRKLAFVHDAVADQIRILGVVHDQRVEVARVGERAAHHLGVDHALRAIGERDSAGGFQEADLGKLRAFQSLG